MTQDQLIIMGILVATIAMFLWGKWRHDMVAVGSLLACVLAGLVAPGNAFSGFGHPAVVTVACVLVLSRGLQLSGAVDVLTRNVLPANAGPTVSIAALAALAAVLSGFMNNVGALALLMPVAIQVAGRLGLAPGRVLMPLAFGSILGGTTTLIGTPPNLIISGFRENQAGMSGYAMFDFAYVGVPLTVVGVAFIALAGWRLVPNRKHADTGGFETGAYITEVRIPEGSSTAGKRLREIEAVLEEGDAQVVDLVRNGVHMIAPRPSRVLRAGDILMLEADVEALSDVLSRLDLKLEEDKRVSAGEKSADAAVPEDAGSGGSEPALEGELPDDGLPDAAGLSERSRRSEQSEQSEGPEGPEGAERSKSASLPKISILSELPEKARGIALDAMSGPVMPVRGSAAKAGEKPVRKHEKTAAGGEAVLMEMAVLPASEIASRSASDLLLRTRFSINLLAVSRQGRYSMARLRSLRIQPGDVLLLQGAPENLAEFANHSGCVPLAQRDLRIPDKRKAAMATGIMLVSVGVAALGLLPAAVSFAAGVLASMALRTVPLRSAYESVDWPVVVLLASLLPVAGAMQSTEAADLVARFLLDAVAQGNAMVGLAVIMVTTMVLTDLMNNAATAAVMAPIGLGAAVQLEANPDTFLMAVAISASCAFLTPIGHQNNTLILGPGGFRFGDYWRMGLPTDLIVLAVSLPLLVWFWPL
ncbi:SLC13 family permease [Desulfovibrio psychrotolerans]|uniref:RCK C-terminal domain-containing protein n=1 Tax=Desulfovibrio psychrotolerans TaxID=415242 RepID=A0A7J0BVU7_9BACT|nr:SLC13 family permease [Desulfovibrio psychrotolerans]GFM37813.1 hypothetical protein DSM19430T_24970 [Desulfovibrio psychrotolerans]